MCVAVPGRIESVLNGDSLLREGTVNFGGITKKVSLACVPEAQEGQYVLVHVGMAISVVDEDEARKVFEYLDEMGEFLDLGNGAS